MKSVVVEIGYAAFDDRRLRGAEHSASAWTICLSRRRRQRLLKQALCLDQTRRREPAGQDDDDHTDLQLLHLPDGSDLSRLSAAAAYRTR